jgi:hypothetical protein
MTISCLVTLVCGSGGGDSTASRVGAAHLPDLPSGAQPQADNSEFTSEFLFPVPPEKLPTSSHRWTTLSKLGMTKAGPYRHCAFPQLALLSRLSLKPALRLPNDYIITGTVRFTRSHLSST